MPRTCPDGQRQGVAVNIGLLNRRANTHKWIISLLLPHRCRGAMSRKQPRIIRQSKYLCLYTFLQLFPISARQVCAADRTGKDQVSAEADVFKRNIKNAMPRRMSGREAHFKLHTPQSQYLSLIKIDRGFRAGINIEAEDRATASGTPQDMIVWM